MKVKILHENLEWAEQAICKELMSKDIDCDLCNIRNVKIDDLIDSNLILNRIYASVANRDYTMNYKTLELLKELEKQNIPVLNSYKTTLADYNKFYSYQLMKQNNVPTPETMLIDEENKTYKKAIEFSEKFGFPIVIKRNIGGRGKDIYLAKDISSLMTKINEVFSPDHKRQYNGGYIVQEFIPSIRDHDARIAVIDDEFAFSYGRTLVKHNDSKHSWLASCANGSLEIKYDATKEEQIVAINASKAIEALFNEVDMCFSEKGPIIIENNPTPNYSPDEILKVKDAVNRIINYSKNKFNKVKYNERNN